MNQNSKKQRRSIAEIGFLGVKILLEHKRGAGHQRYGLKFDENLARLC
ncbi:hypothetical protein ACI8B_20036 [Acinetobacter proteolyticus]|uniref:Uncharacterized protein n=1 Tax=Acinetobacter proteolyticus TaxID=1776741 RepID=A0A653K321_9GAMM|nr:hypothetical protein ACI8B_20036 [Acinetobacter proteolyticus]